MSIQYSFQHTNALIFYSSVLKVEFYKTKSAYESSFKKGRF